MWCSISSIPLPMYIIIIYKKTTKGHKIVFWPIFIAENRVMDILYVAATLIRKEESKSIVSTSFSQKNFTSFMHLHRVFFGIRNLKSKGIMLILIFKIKQRVFSSHILYNMIHVSS